MKTVDGILTIFDAKVLICLYAQVMFVLTLQYVWESG